MTELVGQHRYAGPAQSDKKCEECIHKDKDFITDNPCKDCWNSEDRNAWRHDGLTDVDREASAAGKKDMLEESCPLCGNKFSFL